MASSDIFQQYIDAITNSLPHAPESYKIRLIVQLTLCALLAVLGTVFVTLHWLYEHKRGRSFWLVRLQRGQDNQRRSIVVNSIPLFAFLSIFTGIGQCATRAIQWRAYVTENRSLDNLTLAGFVPWTVIFVQAWAFSFTNLQATFTAKRHLGNKASRLSSAILHNVIFITVPTFTLCILIPLVILTNQKRNQVVGIVSSALGQLKEAQARYLAGKPVDFKALLELQQKQKPITHLNDIANHWLVIVCAVCCIFAAVLLTMNVYSLLLVLVLRKHVKANRGRRTQHQQSLVITQQCVVSVDDLNSTNSPTVADPTTPQIHTSTEQAPIQKKLTAARPFSAFQQQTTSYENARTTHFLSQNELALERLASDLFVSVPLIIVMCILGISVVGMIAVTTSRGNQSWFIMEFTQDSFCYMYTVTCNIVICFFILHLVRSWLSPSIEDTSTFVKADSTSQQNNANTNRYTLTLEPMGKAKADSFDDSFDTPHTERVVEMLDDNSPTVNSTQERPSSARSPKIEPALAV